MKQLLFLTLFLSSFTSSSQDIPDNYKPNKVKPSFTVGAITNIGNFNDVYRPVNLGVMLMYTGYYKFGVFGNFSYGDLTRFNFGLAVRALPILRIYAGFGGVSFDGLHTPIREYNTNVSIGTIIGFPIGPGIQLGVDLGNPSSSKEISINDAMLTLGINFTF